MWFSGQPGLHSVGGNASEQHSHPALVEGVSQGDTSSLCQQRGACGAGKGGLGIPLQPHSPFLLLWPLEPLQTAEPGQHGALPAISINFLLVCVVATAGCLLT